VPCTVLKVDDLEGPWVAFTVYDGPNAANTVSSCNHCNVANLKLDVIEDFATGEVIPHRVVHLDIRIWILDRTPVMGDTVWNALWSLLDVLDLAELVCGLILADPVDAELALGVVQNAKLLLRFLNIDYVHEASWEEHVCSHLSIDLDQALHDNHLRLVVGERILETVAEQDDQWHALSQLVRSRRWARRKNTLELAQHPVGRGEHALQMLLWPTRHLLDLGFEQDVKVREDL